MPKDYDAFQDVIEGVNGIFGQEQAALDPGLKKHDSVHAQVSKEGVVLQFSCQGCGKPTQLTIEWPEVVALKYGVNPEIALRGHSSGVNDVARWEFLPHEQSWRPHLKCGGCQFWFPIRVSPDEPERFLASARRRGMINPEGEAGIAQICARAAQAGQAVRR